MVTVLHRRQLHADGLSFVLMTSPYAEALAVDAPPSVEAAMTTSASSSKAGWMGG